ncbi:hypothetical protein PAHAL_9G302300 [Panicum hallii]|uniref:Uncharacterized protein n=1 Tax=Panicum hallii TaxID=206008 RepID=A0A2T8I324_9POAL|nr:hypothetical protein PAHAL_9G302300 [Panicum hallii]
MKKPKEKEKKKFVFCKLQLETEAVTIASISSTRPCKKRPKTTFPDHSIQCLCLSHIANPEIPPDSAFFLALIKFSTEIFRAGKTKRCGICATFQCFTVRLN